MKSLAQVISDESECKRWEDCFTHNLAMFDYMVIGCIGEIGTNLLELQSRGAHLYKLSPAMTDFNVLHNNLLDYIFDNSQFNDATFFLMVDSDEKVIGELPTWDPVAYPTGANCLYDYRYPFKNIKWISDRGFLGRNKPTVLGEYHYHYSTLGGVYMADSFKMIHERNYHGRKYNVFGDIDYDLYESKMSWIQCVVEAYCGTQNVLPNDQIALIVIEKSYELIQQCMIPDNVVGEYRLTYLFKYLWMKWNLEYSLGKTDAALKTIDQMLKANQRIGIVLEYMTNGRKDGAAYLERYLNFKCHTVQAGDVIDPYKIWNLTTMSLPTEKML